MPRRSLPALLLVLAIGGLLAVPVRPAGADGPALKRNGGYLGFFLRETDDGVTIERLHPGSMAEQAGFRAGDAIREVNGRPLENGDALIRWLWSGRELKVGIRRGDEDVTITTSTRDLDALPQLEDVASDFTLPSKDGDGTHSLKALLSKGRPVVLVFGSFT